MKIVLGDFNVKAEKGLVHRGTTKGHFHHYVTSENGPPSESYYSAFYQVHSKTLTIAVSLIELESLILIQYTNLDPLIQ